MKKTTFAEEIIKDIQSLKQKFFTKPTWKHKAVFWSVVVLSLIVSLQADDNTTATEMERYNEKYLKGRMTSENNKDIAKLIKISDAVKQKDVNVTMQQIEKNMGKELYADRNSSEAKGISEMINKKEFVEKIKDNKRYILDNYSIQGKKLEMSAETKAIVSKSLESTHGGNNEMLFIVVSSSMPDEDIRQYFRELEGKENVLFVLRGLVGEGLKKFEPTRKYIQKLTKKYPDNNESDEAFSVNFEINPKITRKYNIEKVPAVIYVKNYNNQVQQAEAYKKESGDGETYYVSYGTASLEYIFKEINKEAKSEWLENLLQKETFFKTPKATEAKN